MILQVAVFITLLPGITPGVVRPLTMDQVCSTHWGLDVRHVTFAMKKEVYASYKIPVTERSKYVIDHLIPRELGGADEVANLWPQTRAEAKIKDRIENALHSVVCTPSSKVTLELAQQQMREWRDATPKTIRVEREVK
jgi:hypothetical protein